MSINTYRIKEIRVILLRSATAFILTQTLKSLNCPELPCTVFLKRNSFKKARKQVVTTKLFMNVLLQFRNENLQISVSEIYLAGTITQFKISFRQNWPRMLLIEVTY